MQYTPLMETDSIHGSVPASDPIRSKDFDHSCRTCKNKLIRKQAVDHTPMQCLNQRCELLESDMTGLKDREMKSHLQIKALEGQISVLEEAIRRLTMPKQSQATPFAFAAGHHRQHQLKKVQSEDLTVQKANINYDNIIQPTTSNNRGHVGLFGSLGASSQR